jgi:hypothetical protein
LGAKPKTEETEKRVTATFVRYPLKGYSRRLPGVDSPGYVAPDLCTYISFESTLKLRQDSACRHFPCGNITCWLANSSFAAIFATPKLTGLHHLGHFAGKAQNYGSPKNSLFEENHLAVRQWCSETVTLACYAWRMLPPLAAGYSN